jgi:hypothetical protein
VSDIMEKNANLARDVFSRPPTGSYEGTPAHGSYVSGAQHSGIDPGSAATALFTVGLIVDRAARKAAECYKEHPTRS